MLKRLVFVLLFATAFTQSSQAQDRPSWLYKGKIGTYPVTLFIREFEGCSDDQSYVGMYRYDNKSSWLLLYIEQKDKKHWCLTEDDFSGVLLLDMSSIKMEGIWISPDRKRQLDATMNVQYPTREERAELSERLEQLMLEVSGCG